MAASCSSAGEGSTRRISARSCSGRLESSYSENSRRQVPGACYSRVLPTPVSSPTLIGWSSEVATLLDLDPVPTHADLMARVFSGNLVLPGMDPFAMCYGGHQLDRKSTRLNSSHRT